MAISAPPSSPTETISIEALFEPLDACLAEILRVNLQTALKHLADHTDTRTLNKVEFLGIKSVTATQITQMYALPLDASVVNGAEWQQELQRITPTIFRVDFDVTKLADPEFLRKNVRMYLVDIKVPIFEAVISRDPKLFHETRALVVLVGDEPKAGNMIVDSRIYPETRPRNAEEAMRYDFTNVHQENDMPQSFEVLMGNIAYALGRTIKAELGVISRKH